MTKVQANYRIDSTEKQKAEAILQKIGLRPTDAVNMLMHHIAIYKELPFNPSIPNEETAQALTDTDSNIGLTRYKNTNEMFENILD